MEVLSCPRCLANLDLASYFDHVFIHGHRELTLPNDSNLSSLIDLYDTDFFKIETVVRKLNDSVGKPRQMEGFRKEIIERFQEQGFVVGVKCWSTQQEGVYAFDVEITDRCEPLRNGFDHERQSWEVQNDVLNFGEAGSFGLDGRLITPSKSTLITKKD